MPRYAIQCYLILRYFILHVPLMRHRLGSTSSAPSMDTSSLLWIKESKRRVQTWLTINSCPQAQNDNISWQEVRGKRIKCSQRNKNNHPQDIATRPISKSIRYKALPYSGLYITLQYHASNIEQCLLLKRSAPESRTVQKWYTKMASQKDNTTKCDKT